MTTTMVEMVRAPYVAVGDLVVWAGAWQLVTRKARMEPNATHCGLELRDRGGTTSRVKMKATGALRTLAGPLVPPHVLAEYMVTDL